MTDKSTLLPLKVLVISLGIILCGGFLIIVAALAGKTQHPMDAHCADATVKLPEEGDIMNISAHGERVEITVAYEGGTKLLTADRCSGQILSTLSVELPPMPPPPAETAKPEEAPKPQEAKP